ncbi:hydroxyacid dehydrogenase [Flavipsychrobacter stenotrophus]|uniref:Hydroxyacid dehydrogenase n=1 Tax=Flavipsychrobacter stenotrophus TaxID=2077091 RepID=A0A2S7SQ08_9BACT|nr:NAD(P)-dependent oxidoreductase [Flavipsychrobacter stenotrophus]PQJ08834.1 hydroxyacid dehydrogenase [Flavipsychrobacter stenotrophus]
MIGQKGRVLIAAPVHEVLIEGLIAGGYTCDVHEHITQSTAHTLVGDYVGIITSTRLQLDSILLDLAINLKWIGRMGSGMEVIDVSYATRKGVECYSSPEGNCNAVGEHAVGMLLDLNRRITISNGEMKHGLWLRNENRGIELEGKNIGIIGFGHTGRAFAKKLQGFDMTIYAYDKYMVADTPSYVINATTIEEIFSVCDIISFHVPLQEDTVEYFNWEFILNMKKRFTLINTSRGQVVNTIDLLRGIKEGRISGACLDVFEQEPISAMNEEVKNAMAELMIMNNVITTPHIAGYTFEALYKMSYVLLIKITS